VDVDQRLRKLKEGNGMKNILLIADETTDMKDSVLIEEAAALHPDQVTVLIPGESNGWESDSSAEGTRRRDRLASLLARIADRTGAAVMGTVASPSRADDGHFAAVIAPTVAVPA
jgi:formate dehydrogenase maturation protein FdhE